MRFTSTTWFVNILAALIYFVSDRIGLFLAFDQTNASPVWPASGLAIIMVLLWGYRILPGIWLGAIVANFMAVSGNGFDDPTKVILISLGVSIGNISEAFIGGFLVKKYLKIEQGFTAYYEVFGFVLAAFAAALAASVIAISTFCLGGVISWDKAFIPLITWFLGDFSAIVLLVPLVLLWRVKTNDVRISKPVEFWLNLALVAFLTWYIFIDRQTSEAQTLKTYFILPCLMWAAFRFSRREITVILNFVALVVILGTALGRGPFISNNLQQSLIELQVFIVVIYISFLSLSVILFQYNENLKQLELGGKELSLKVEERTKELSYQIEEHKRTAHELAIMQEEFVQACEIAKLGHFQWDVIQNKLYWSDQVYEIFGVNSNVVDVSYQTYQERLYPLDRDYVNEVLTHSFESKQPYSIYHRIVQQSTSNVRWVHSRGSVVTNDKGEVVQMLGTVIDVTDIKEKELLNEHLAEIIENSSDGILSLATDGTIVSRNKAAEIMLGWNGKNVVGANFFDRWPFLTAKESGLNRMKSALNGHVLTVDEQILNGNGVTEMDVWVTYSPIRANNGAVGGVSLIVRDITERKEKEDTRFKLIVDSAPNVIILVNQEGTIEMANSQVEKTFGYNQAELIGQNMGIIFPERFRDNIDPINPSFFHFLESVSSSARQDVFVLDKSGIEIPVELRLSPIEIAGGEMMLVSIADITSLKKMEEARREQEVVKETVRLKDQFMANMSHEIRTPMNAIVGFTDLLDKTELKPEQRDYLWAIKSSGINLLTIINDILDLSRIHEGRIQLERLAMSVPDIARNLSEIFGPRAKEKNLELVYTSVVPENLVVWGDPVRLSQILMNLLSNALKFTEHGKVELGMRVAEEDEKYISLEFWVKDTGIGIPHDKLVDVFDRFTQASSDTTRKYGGTGLGLSIVKGLIDIQGGTVDVESKVGEGTKFVFSIEYERYLESEEFVSKPSHPVNNGFENNILGLKILLVEDNKLNQKLAATVLSKNGGIVEVVENGEEAVKKLASGAQYNVVLMDIQMPIMDGYEATKAIREKLHNNIPIVAMTAHAMAGERDKCLSLGMNDYLSKPFQQDQLIQIILTNSVKIEA